MRFFQLTILIDEIKTKEVFLKNFGNTFGSRKVEVYLRRMIEMLLRSPIVLYPRRQRLFLLRRVIYWRRNGDGSSSIELCKNKFLFPPPPLSLLFFFFLITITDGTLKDARSFLVKIFQYIKLNYFSWDRLR